MKNTKYLFDEGRSPVGMVSVSQIQTYLSCKKKWEYNYIEGLTPRVDRAYLTIGKLCHRGMQVAMQWAWAYQRSNKDEDYTVTGRWVEWRNAGIEAIGDEWREYMEETPMLDEEIPDFNQMLHDAVSVFRQAFEEFEPWRYEVITLYKGQKLIPALELHFRVPCLPTKGLHGYIDAILRDKETGFVWCTDYKFRKSLSPDEDEAFNIQNAVYAYACQKMGVDITGTMTWQHINTPAADPTILKNGQISRAKIKTTWEHFRNFCIKNHVDTTPYELEMKEKLRDIEWCRSTLEYRNEETINKIWDECVIPVAKCIFSANKKKANNFRSLYPWNCKMCQYQSLCQAELRGYDAEAIKSREYTRRTTLRGDLRFDQNNCQKGT